MAEKRWGTTGSIVVVLLAMTLAALSISTTAAAPSTEAELTRLYIAVVTFDADTETPLLLLSDKQQRVALPIGIGPFEARAISMALEDKEPPRPSTHDLFATVLDNLGAVVNFLVITKLENQTYYGELVIETVDEGQTRVDCRPSDGMALAARKKFPIYATPQVMEQAIKLKPGKGLNAARFVAP